MAEVLVVGKKISEMDLVTNIVGDEKIPTGAVGDKAVTTGQLLTYVNNNGVAQWGRIGGDIANQADLQNQFAQERDNLKNYTQEQVSQQQEVIQNQIDTTNQGLNYILENGAALPYDESIEYAEGAPVLKDGVIKYRIGGSFKSRDSVTVPTYSNPADGVDSVTGVAEGAYYNVRSPDDDSFLVEYQNVGGVPTPTGKSYPSSEFVQHFVGEVAVISNKQIKHNKAFPSVLDHADVVGDGVVSDSIALQEYFRDADDNRKSSIFFPLRNYNYLIDSPLSVQEPLMIYGDAGATYNRGIGKDGKIIIGGTHAFDLGNYRTWTSNNQNIDTKNSKNPADNWTLKNLAFIQKAGDPVRTKTAILHTAKTNGPDRGLIMREVSSTGLKHVLRTVDNGVQTQIATVVVENCVISNNELPLKFDGMCYGLRFVGNQCEQNTLGAIKGRVDAHITIEDNMLEGQRDVIDLEIPATGNRPKISFKRNYLESNTGDFIFRAKTSTPDSAIDVGGNFYWNHQAKHYVYLQGVSWLVNNTDSFPVSLGPNTYVKYGSRILNSNIMYYKQDGTSSGGFGSSVVTSDFVGRLALPDYTPSNSIPDTVSAFETPLGSLRAYTSSLSSLTIPLPVSAGDLYSITILMSTDSGLTSSNIQVLNQDLSAVVNETGGVSYGTTRGNLALVTYTFKANISATSLRVRVYNATIIDGKRKLFGACAKNHGAYVEGELHDIYVSMPPLTRVYPSQNLNYSVTASPTLNLTANTDITTTVNDARFKVGDSIIVSITQSATLITRASALVKSAGVATVVLTPNVTSSGAVIGLKLKVVEN